MVSVIELKNNLDSGAYSDKLAWLYGCNPKETKGYADRYIGVLNALENAFGGKKFSHK